MKIMLGVLALASVVVGCESAPTENLGEAQQLLSVAVPNYSISSDNAPATNAACNDPNSSTWCKCGYNYTDNAPRCNEAKSPDIMPIPPLGCEVATATLSYQVTMWAGSSPISLRRILRPMSVPTMGQAGYCATTSQPSWYRSGPEAWTLPGGKGDGTDRSIAGVDRILASGGQRIESFDVTSLMGGCSSGCTLAQFNQGTAHVNILAGTVSLVYTCAGPASVCGDSTLNGVEQCDDGNVINGDGCSSTCAMETGWSCTGEPSVCTTTCGDSVKAGLEQCDDGNLISHDGCSITCTKETCVWQ